MAVGGTIEVKTNYYIVPDLACNGTVLLLFTLLYLFININSLHIDLHYSPPSLLLYFTLTFISVNFHYC